MFVHPGDATTPATTDYRLASSISRPADNCLSLARLIVRGIFEQFPTLKLVGSHLGGGICEVIGRMDYAYNLPDFAFFLGPYEPMLIKHPPSHYLKMMYFDSASYWAPAAEMCLKCVGADHFLFGTDSPPMIPLKMHGLKMMDRNRHEAGRARQGDGWQRGAAAEVERLEHFQEKWNPVSVRKCDQQKCWSSLCSQELKLLQPASADETACPAPGGCLKRGGDQLREDHLMFADRSRLSVGCDDRTNVSTIQS